MLSESNKDPFLLFYALKLQKIHEVFFQRYDETGSPPDVREIKQELSSKAMEGINAVFFDVFKSDQD